MAISWVRLPYWPKNSISHKAVNAISLVPLFALGVMGWASSWRHGACVAVTTTGVAVFGLTCMVTFVDHDQRCPSPAELFVMPLGAVGFERVLSWVAA
ncbi:MAG TPA: hypothetical protein VGQ62_22745 [Chloroflexota bacterium]|nr:hypothetical protein [Chloroflexota bacterium]